MAKKTVNIYVINYRREAEGEIMGYENSPQFVSQNGVVYICSETDGCWYEIRKSDNLPIDVVNQAKEFLKKAEILKANLTLAK
jgi:hypothetical protein